MNLKIMRECKGFSVDSISSMCRISRQAYSSIENCHVNPYNIKVGTLQLLACSLEVSLDEMLRILVDDYMAS